MFQQKNTQLKPALYSPRFEHDNCGIGAVVNIKGKKSHGTVENALTIVETLEHRAGKDAEGKTGDGVGILLQISHTFFKKAAEKLGISRSSLYEKLKNLPDADTCPGTGHDVSERRTDTAETGLKLR